MSSTVIGVTASHTTLMNTHWHELVHVDRAERFRAALGSARERVAAARPDVAVIIGSNHFRGMFLDLMPAFTIGVGDCIASGEAGTPSGPQKVDAALARHFADHLVEAEFDIAFSARLQVDHGITHALQYVLHGLDLPIVPIVVNVFAPPLPSLRRCQALGGELRRALGTFMGERRVAVIASGGLSHRLPWPDWRAPASEDDEFMVEAWLEGRTRWKDYEVRRREIVMKASGRRSERPPVSAEFDHAFLDAWRAGGAGPYLDWTTADLQEAAGNGAQELRTWIIARAMLEGDAPPRTEVLTYEEIPEWLTGMAVTVLDPAA